MKIEKGDKVKMNQGKIGLLLFTVDALKQEFGQTFVCGIYGNINISLVQKTNDPRPDGHYQKLEA